MRRLSSIPRRALAAAGLVLIACVLVPPVTTMAARYAFAQAAQFAVLAVAGPALIVLGAPWPAGLAARVATARSHHPGPARSWAVLVGFILVVIAWRIPAVVDALARHPFLIVAEVVSLLAAGCALWLELVASPPLLPVLARPMRAVFAAVAMWTIWIVAYIMGFSRGVWFTAFAHQPGHGLGTVADQQIAAAVLWALPGLCFVPVVFVSWISWLRDSADPDTELRQIAAAPGAAPSGPLRPPRGWRLPSG